MLNLAEGKYQAKEHILLGQREKEIKKLKDRKITLVKTEDLGERPATNGKGNRGRQRNRRTRGHESHSKDGKTSRT